jgi:hypothetical protein
VQAGPSPRVRRIESQRPPHDEAAEERRRDDGVPQGICEDESAENEEDFDSAMSFGENLVDRFHQGGLFEVKRNPQVESHYQNGSDPAQRVDELQSRRFR